VSEGVALRVLVAGDEARLFEFLGRYLESSLFFFSNIERAGLVDRGEPFQGTYLACFDASGELSAVVGHAWNGNLFLQGDAGLELLAQSVAQRSGRPIRGLIGPWPLVCRARRALGLDETAAAHDGHELLYDLQLRDLRRPELLSRSDVELRVPSASEAVDVVASWRADYHVEILGKQPSAELEARARREVEAWLVTGSLWVLSVSGKLVAMTGFNAEARGIVQIGGVFTPPPERARGYARSAVAASLELARARGFTRSVLFTERKNRAAQRAYEALGYRPVGDFGLVLF
jgi:RimJ/RimL family protein N-acetyltransferase